MRSGEDASKGADQGKVDFAEREAAFGSGVAERAGENSEVVSVEDFLGHCVDMMAGC